MADRQPSDASTRRVYFDTQQWNYFADPGPGLHPGRALRRARRAQKVGSVEIVGSLDLLQELIEALPNRPRKARRMIDYFFQLVGDRLLLPLSERHPQEAAAGGILTIGDRYLSHDLRRGVRRLAQSHADVFEVAERLREEKTAFLEAELRVQQLMCERLSQEGVIKRAPLMRDWISDVDIDSWVREIVDDGHDRGRIPDGVKPRPDQVPSVSSFVACRLGRLARTMGDGRKIQGSDLADAHHVACAPYIDVLVTDDKELRNSLDLVRDRLPCQWMSSEEFFATLQ